ncbi:MAG: glycosyltransferase [Caldilineaceae bacterium]
MTFISPSPADRRCRCSRRDTARGGSRRCSAPWIRPNTTRKTWPIHWDLGYMGTYSADRQPGLDRLLLDPARRWTDGHFIVAGPQFPDDLVWPDNVDRWDHVPPSKHRRFYNSQRYTLNVTRAAMVEAGHAPSVRLFEAAACGTPIISDWWEGLDSYFTPGEEILIADSCDETLGYLRMLSDEQRRRIGAAARVRALREHTSDHRARQLERYAAYVAADGGRPP